MVLKKHKKRRFEAYACRNNCSKVSVIGFCITTLGFSRKHRVDYFSPLESITFGLPMRVFELLFQKWRHIELEFDIGTIARDLTNPQQTVYVILASVSPASAFAYGIYRNLRLNRTIDINVKDKKYLNCIIIKNY